MSTHTESTATESESTPTESSADPTVESPTTGAEVVETATAKTDADLEQTDADPEQTEQPAEDEAPAAAEDEQPKRSSRAADLEREGEIAADFLETLLDIADLDGDLEVAVEGDRAAVSIVDSEDGPAPRRLVGPGATVLEALQELTRLAVQAETGDRSRLMLDVANYRADRRATLVAQAQQVIGEVRESGEERELEPMSAFERKVVHDEVLAAGLVSESEGEEPHRFVVVRPA